MNTVRQSWVLWVGVFFALSTFSACATPAAVKQGFDFSKVHRVYVRSFQGEGGAVVSGEFMRQLVTSGLEIVDRPGAADVILDGVVSDFRPGQKLMVFLGETNTLNNEGKTQVVTNPVVSLNGSQVVREGTAFGLPNTQIVSVSSTVGVMARLVDQLSGTVVWASQYSYEGMDTQSATESVVHALIRSLASVIPRATS